MQHYLSTWEEMAAAGGQFEMEEITVRGIPMRVFKNAPPTMRAFWELTAGYADRDYIVYEDERYTYAEVAATVRSLAHHLRDAHGVTNGDRVAISMRNFPEWVMTYWATVSLGAAVVGMNAWWTSEEMKFGMTDAQPKVAVVDDERIERLLPVLEDIRAESPMHVISVRSDRELPADCSRWSDVVDGSTAPTELPAAEIDPDDDVCIFYTSGTTGFPKGAQLTHRGSVHNVMNLVFMSLTAATAEAKAKAAGDIEGKEMGNLTDAASQPVYMAPTPLFHVTANNCLLQPCTLVGGKIVLTYKWDPTRALELIEREGVTTFSGVPTMSRELISHPDWEKRNTSTIQGMGGGGAALQPDLVEKIDKSLSKGAPSTGYGLTETHGIVTANAAKFFVEKPASCGRAVPVCDVKLVDDEGNEVEMTPEARGQLCVRGPIVVKGYINRPDAIREGWFNTGDIAMVDDDGFIYIVDRAKDMVLRGGENVYSAEVEAAIYQNEAVAEAAVFGVPDDRLGEEVGVAIYLHPGSSLIAEQLQEFLGASIAKHKVPRYVWILDEQLPRNASGKFLKRDLKERLIPTL
jgi:acyl-CoA synthetase (AMP-forming)/AMP-acid ligase II